MQGIIIMILATVLFGVTIQGNILLVIGLLMLGVFSFVGLGVSLNLAGKRPRNSINDTNGNNVPNDVPKRHILPVKMMPASCRQ
jgi:hypothetical protein